MAWKTIVGWNEEGQEVVVGIKAIAQDAWPDNEWQEVKQDDETTAIAKRKSERRRGRRGEKGFGREELGPWTKPSDTPCRDCAPTTGCDAGLARG